MTELDKYQGIYASPEKFPTYGHSNHGKGIVPWVKQMKPESLLDVGCGWNEFKRDLGDSVPRVIGVDFACPGADMLVDAQALPFGDHEFDVLTAFDMLEHLREEQVPVVLAEFARVSSRFVFSISYQASVNKWQGQTLHPTVKPEAWWITQLMRVGAVGITKRGRYLCGRWQPVLSIAPGDSVVLVGNGPSLLDAEMGEQIDAHKHVIRFNNYEITGWEKHTGTKTSWWSFISRAAINPRKCPRVLCLHESDKADPTAEAVHHLPGMSYQRCRSYVQEAALVRSGFERDTSGLLATSGLQVAWYLLHVVGVQKLRVVGFDHFSKQVTSRHHYWNAQGYGKPPEHDGDLESSIFADWAALGKVEYLKA